MRRTIVERGGWDSSNDTGIHIDLKQVKVTTIYLKTRLTVIMTIRKPFKDKPR